MFLTGLVLMASEEEGDTWNLLATGTISPNLFSTPVAAWAPEEKGRECFSRGSFKALEAASYRRQQNEGSSFLSIFP